jgi:hypothetical protein
MIEIVHNKSGVEKNTNAYKNILELKRLTMNPLTAMAYPTIIEMKIALKI